VNFYSVISKTTSLTVVVWVQGAALLVPERVGKVARGGLYVGVCVREGGGSLGGGVKV